MARAAIQWLRQSDGDWKAVGVWLGTKTTLQSRFDPAAGLQDFVQRIHEGATPPSTPGGPPGTWEDWIGRALDGLSNGHDLMVSEVDPEVTVDELYAREVLELPPAQRAGFKLAGIPNLTSLPVPDLTGRMGRA